jgi:hypothetical protein
MERMNRLASDLREIGTKVYGAGKKIIFVYNVPEISFNVPDKVGFAVHFHRALPEGPLKADVVSQRARVEQAVKIGFAGLNVQTVDPIDFFCSDRCAIADGTTPLYFDHHHLGISSVQRVAAMFRQTLGQQ